MFLFQGHICSTFHRQLKGPTTSLCAPLAFMFQGLLGVPWNMIQHVQDFSELSGILLLIKANSTIATSPKVKLYPCKTSKDESAQVPAVTSQLSPL